MAQENSTQPVSGGIPPIVIVIAIVVVVVGIGYFLMKPATPAPGAKPATAPATPAAKTASVDSVVDPNSPTGYVDSGGIPVNKDGSDYTGTSNYVNIAVSNFGKGLGF